MKKRKFAVAGLVLVFTVASGVPQADIGAAPPSAVGASATGDPVLAWNEITGHSMITAGISPVGDPMHESRIYAMVHIAVHDALNAIKRRSRPYALDLGPMPAASPDAAAAAAAHDVLVAVLRQLPAEVAPGIQKAVDEVDAAYDAALADVTAGNPKTQGVYIGQAAAAAILALRVTDGSDTEFFDHTPIVNPQPGDFRWVDDNDFQVLPGWAKVTPFVMTSPSQLRPPPPYDLRSKKYAIDFNELKELGDIDSKTRNADQTEIAFFWFENSPFKWNRIARTVSTSAGLGVWENARLFALLNVAEADGYIGNWESKQFYNRWRPSTAVHLADIDGNPLTTADKTWVPLWGSSGGTPEYDSGHTIEGAAAATVLADVLGTDNVSFTDCSTSFVVSRVTDFTPEDNCDGAHPITRDYTSFSQAAWENGNSRIYVGWHFRNAVESGFRHGTKLGSRAVNHFFRPTH
jgi:PAP2 superfamily